MAKFYLAVPDSFTIPTDGNQIALSSACILRRDDSAVPTFLPLDADGYTVFIADTGDTATATAFAISSTSPTDNATDVAVDTAITITFNANIAFGTGNITIRDNDGGWADLEAFDVTTDTGGGAGTVSISGAVLTIEPTADLANSIEYAIRIDATAIDTTDGVSFAGIADDTTVSFTTVAAATAPAAFTSGQWTSATGSGASEIDIGITTLPSDGGSAITALQYSVDNGSTWANLTGTGTGSRTIDQHSDGITGTLTAATSYNVKVRAVNAVNPGADSDTKATTTGAATGTIDEQIIAAIGSKARRIYDLRSFDNLSQDNAHTTPVTATGQNVRGVADLSSYGVDTLGSVDATYPLSQSGHVDLNGGAWLVATTDLGTTSEVYLVHDINGETGWTLAGKISANVWYCGKAADGDSGAVDGSFPATITHMVNGADQSSPTRNTLHDAVAAVSGDRISGARGIDFTSGTYLTVPGGSSVSNRSHTLAKYIVICDALTAGERSALNDILETV